jgi:hypothetical protein
MLGEKLVYLVLLSPLITEANGLPPPLSRVALLHYFKIVLDFSREYCRM